MITDPKNVLEYWMVQNAMSIPFLMMELERFTGLTLVKANGIITYVGEPTEPVGYYLIGKTFNMNLEEILVEEIKKETQTEDEKIVPPTNTKATPKEGDKEKVEETKSDAVSGDSNAKTNS
jgi:hypothetical protein